ncbi:MAG: hypothetical protein DRQ88_13405 [Epsilonproteobacteria bacterium]|nr:MAG: hypothetical protein DRQ89_09255 [Campylobacterota bacterium]RLA62609.1 MAG: hypothetical protein DRQ88_13405 [Campylobacterota bacterium]
MNLPEGHKLVTLHEKPENIDLYQNLIDTEWEQIGTMDDNAYEYWYTLLNKFPRYQFGLFIDGDLAAVGNTCPVYIKRGVKNLPNGGWGEALKQSITNNKTPNLLCGLSATIKNNYRGRGLSKIVLGQMKEIAKEEGFSQLVVPVRPTLKNRYPLINIKDYIHWKNDDGRLFDPWLRIHMDIGGELLGIAHKSMVATRPISTWEELFKMPIKSSGDYILPGGLTPSKVNLKKNVGVYEEPNIWFVHPS